MVGTLNSSTTARALFALILLYAVIPAGPKVLVLNDSGSLVFLIVLKLLPVNSKSIIFQYFSASRSKLEPLAHAAKLEFFKSNIEDADTLYILPPFGRVFLKSKKSGLSIVILLTEPLNIAPDAVLDLPIAVKLVPSLTLISIELFPPIAGPKSETIFTSVPTPLKSKTPPSLANSIP